MFQPISPELSPVFARFMDERSPWDVSRQAASGAPGLWPALVEEIGVAGLLIDEDLGGQGATLTELAAAVAETARCGWSGPLVATSGAAVTLLQRVDPGDASGLLAQIAEGAVVVVAFHEDARGDSLDTAAFVDDLATIYGRKTFIDSGMHAEVVLVPAIDRDGQPVLARVDVTALATPITAMDAVDPGRGLAALALDGVEASIVATGPGVTESIHDAWLTAALLTSVDLLGAAIRAFVLALEYAGVREQFGRPIASFQSIKHKLVDMYGELQTAYSAVIAAVAMSPDDPEWRFAVSAAKVRTSDAAMDVLRESIQVHGGIGFTWEHEVSHHFRRVVTARALYGTPTRHRALIADLHGF